MNSPDRQRISSKGPSPKSFWIQVFARKIYTRAAGAARSSAEMTIPHWVLVAFIVVYYSPLAVPGWGWVRVHDNLDSEIVYNQLSAWILFGKDGSETLALNGNLPWHALNRFGQPLTYFYAFFPAATAYWVNDAVVRYVAALGAFLLAKHLTSRVIFSLALSFAFTVSINLTIHGFAIAGGPILLWILLRAPTLSRIRFRSTLALVFFLGWNSPLMIAGIFYLILLPVILRILDTKVFSRHSLEVLLMYGLGLALGSAGIIFGRLSGFRWHREEFGIAPFNFTAGFSETFLGNIWAILGNGNFWSGWPFDHTTQPLTFVVTVAIILMIVSRKPDSRALKFAALGVGICLFYALIQTKEVMGLKMSFSGLVREFNFDRFFFVLPLVSFLILCTAVFILSVRGERILLVTLLIQLGLMLGLTPHFRPLINFISPVDLTSNGQTLVDYYEAREFELLLSQGTLESEDVILSINRDPMKPLMSGLKTVDGYFTLYPLDYKHRFSVFMAEDLGSYKEIGYFNEWGSRVYYFHENYPFAAPKHLDLCKASQLGVTKIISSSAIPILSHALIWHSSRPSLDTWIYAVSPCDF